ncbi:flagellar biosynthesis protein FlhB [Limnoglobus roseus]|uniref:Flagellar biosynthetic protein FlhB n=1 Tax=Limnoglobus roseus TaxID=2598579 RepID=A0A5C1A819_9BACT|nr:flagellar biosynthesis protein FlhB [Limnoglobus roseus]QEL13318.1 flagellar biosynthesis protein FlhB [Limnoglobus roseus]
MAEDTDPESKTEDASPKRREDARKQGQIPFSAELVGAAVLLAGIIALSSFGKPLGEAMLGVFRHDIPQAFRGDLTAVDVQMLIARLTLVALSALLPILGILLAAGVATSVVQAGFQITPERLEWKFDRLNPVSGFGRLFSFASVVKGGLGILKVLAVGGVAYFIVVSRVGVITSLGHGTVGGAVVASWGLVTRLALYLAAAAVLISIIDYVYQRRRFETQLRMTKQEVKEEAKESDGDPQLKARMRQIGRERAKRKMLSEVPKATVVITNPTHYAVALRYDTTRDAAPVLVAKGAGAFAERIRQLARESGVPVMERPPLARALYKSVKEGQPIPALLFRAVAELIALVYRLRGAGITP